MFGPTSDPGHKAMCFVLTVGGNVPTRSKIFRTRPRGLRPQMVRAGTGDGVQ